MRTCRGVVSRPVALRKSIGDLLVPSGVAESRSTSLELVERVHLWSNRTLFGDDASGTSATTRTATEYGRASISAIALRRHRQRVHAVENDHVRAMSLDACRAGLGPRDGLDEEALAGEEKARHSYETAITCSEHDPAPVRHDILEWRRSSAHQPAPGRSSTVRTRRHEPGSIPRRALSPGATSRTELAPRRPAKRHGRTSGATPTTTSSRSRKTASIAPRMNHV